MNERLNHTPGSIDELFELTRAWPIQEQADLYNSLTGTINHLFGVGKNDQETARKLRSAAEDFAQVIVIVHRNFFHGDAQAILKMLYRELQMEPTMNVTTSFLNQRNDQPSPLLEIYKVFEKEVKRIANIRIQESLHRPAKPIEEPKTSVLEQLKALFRWK